LLLLPPANNDSTMQIPSQNSYDSHGALLLNQAASETVARTPK
jgi:hypothetical protein